MKTQKEFNNFEEADKFILRLDRKGIIAYSIPENDKIIVHYEIKEA